VAGWTLPPSSCWPPDWSSGSLRSSNKRENAVDRRRWRLRQGALLEARLACGVTVVGRLRKDRRCATCRDNCAAAEGVVRPSAQVWQEQDQSGQACRPSRGLGDGQMHGLRQNGHQALQDLPATYRRSRADSRVVVLEDHDWYPFFSTDPNARP